MTRRAPRRDLEHKLQCAVADYLDRALSGVTEATWFAVPNGGSRRARTARDGRRVSPEGARLKAEGVKPGVADIIVVWRGKIIAIELKTPKPKGYQSKDQAAWEAELTLAGGLYTVCRSVDEVEAFLDVLGLPLRARLTRRSEGGRRNKAA